MGQSWQIDATTPHKKQETFRKTSRSKFCGLANKPHIEKATLGKAKPPFGIFQFFTLGNSKSKRMHFTRLFFFGKM